MHYKSGRLAYILLLLLLLVVVVQYSNIVVVVATINGLWRCGVTVALTSHKVEYARGLTQIASAGLNHVEALIGRRNLGAPR